MSRTTQESTSLMAGVAYRVITVSDRTFQSVRLPFISLYCSPSTPDLPKQIRFGLFRFRSPLLAESFLFSFPVGNEMFQFPTFASLTGWQAFSLPGCPIRRSADRGIFAPPRSFSQLITSFFASESLGILHTPFFTFFAYVLGRLLNTCGMVYNGLL